MTYYLAFQKYISHTDINLKKFNPFCPLSLHTFWHLVLCMFSLFLSLFIHFLFFCPCLYVYVFSFSVLVHMLSLLTAPFPFFGHCLTMWECSTQVEVINHEKWQSPDHCLCWEYFKGTGKLCFAGVLQCASPVYWECMAWRGVSERDEALVFVKA